MKKLKATKMEMEDLPSVNKVILRLKDDGSGGTSKTYQGEVIKLDQSLAFFASKYKTYIDCWRTCMNDLRIALLMLPSWSCIEDSSHSWMAKD